MLDLSQLQNDDLYRFDCLGIDGAWVNLAYIDRYDYYPRLQRAGLIIPVELTTASARVEIGVSYALTEDGRKLKLERGV